MVCYSDARIQGRFSPRSSRPRKTDPQLSTRHIDATLNKGETLKLFNSVHLNLGEDIFLQFDESKGDWIPITDPNKTVSDQSLKLVDLKAIRSELSELRSLNEALVNENRLLKLKVELLIDLIIGKEEVSEL